MAEGQAIHSEPLMYVIRPVAADNLAGLLWLAESAGIGLTTLPPSEKALAEKITASA
ncbi:MAG: arginine N-succinyltransferase [SAR324 cluster bacterium]|nr:arginine N-succinyltransferase [SAR324 cluster bacterium]